MDIQYRHLLFYQCEKSSIFSEPARFYKPLEFFFCEPTCNSWQKTSPRVSYGLSFELEPLILGGEVPLVTGLVFGPQHGLELAILRKWLIQLPIHTFVTGNVQLLKYTLIFDVFGDELAIEMHEVRMRNYPDDGTVWKLNAQNVNLDG